MYDLNKEFELFINRVNVCESYDAATGIGTEFIVIQGRVVAELFNGNLVGSVSGDSNITKV